MQLVRSFLASLLGGTRRAEVLSPEQRRDIGTQGGLVGGRARANSLSKARRSEIAKKAADARWVKKKQTTEQSLED